MDFKKVDYENMKLQSKDRVGSSLIGKRLKQNNNAVVKISEKQVKKATKVLSRFNKNLNEDSNNI